jgi:transmembrane sensor
MTKDSKTQQFDKFLATRKAQNIEEQISEAEQIVHAIEKIDTHEAFIQVRNRIQKQNRHIQFLNVLYRVAAILFIPMLITSVVIFYKLRTENNAGQFSEQQISNPSGVRSEIILPDSSKVWLNAGSTISYKIPFNLNTRNIKLLGEAFFDVKKDKQHPFQVESGKVAVTVLGTRFNYKAFPEDNAIEVTLVEGKVTLNPNGSQTKKELILNPGERAIVNKTTDQTKISSVNIEKYIGWHEGKLIFDECPMVEVARQLERWFGIEVKISDPQILKYKITTTFENESLNQILNLLEIVSPIKTNLILPTVEKTTKNRSKTKVIITSKD